MTLTDPQRRALDAVVRNPGALCRTLARDIYAGDARMLDYRPHHRGVNRSAAAGALGNLAAGRIMARLESMGLVTRDRHYRYTATAAGMLATRRSDGETG